MRIVFELAGEKQIARDILRVGDRGTDMRPAFHSTADFWMLETERNFESEGRHASGGWTPLNPDYLARKLAHRPRLDPRILHATLALFDSLTVEGDENQVLTIRKNELTYGSRLPYAAAHQRPRPGSRLPRRRPVEFTEAARRQTVKILQRYVMTGEVA